MHNSCDTALRHAPVIGVHATLYFINCAVLLLHALLVNLEPAFQQLHTRFANLSLSILIILYAAMCTIFHALKRLRARRFFFISFVFRFSTTNSLHYSDPLISTFSSRFSILASARLATASIIFGRSIALDSSPGTLNACGYDLRSSYLGVYFFILRMRFTHT